MKASAAVIVPLLSISIIAAAQSPTFEVASVKKSPPPGPGGTFGVSGVRKGNSWNATNVTLRTLVRGAHSPRYQMEGRIIGAPGWFDTDRFDIAARIEGTASSEDVSAMVRALLADRFKLVTHAETRELPVYVLGHCKKRRQARRADAVRRRRLQPTARSAASR